MSCDIFDKRYNRYSKAEKPYILIKKCFLFSYIWLIIIDKKGVFAPNIRSYIKRFLNSNIRII